MTDDNIRERGLFGIFRKSTKKSKKSTIKRSANPTVVISSPTDFEENEIDCESLTNKIQDCPFAISGHGHLIFKEQFKECSTNIKLTVFLFEKMCLFTKKEQNRDSYYFTGCINMSNISIPSIAKKKILVLKNYGNRQLDCEYKLEAKSEEIANSWKEAIEKILWKELLFIRDKHKPV